VAEPVTVVVATRNRNASVVRTIASLLEGTERPHDIVVVDQSDDDGTAAAIERFAKDVRYLRSRTTGLARAHNVAIAEARTELIAMTDDDCDVSRDWLAGIAGAFTCDPRVGLVFGGVLPMPHDPALGFVPSYVREEAFLARSLADKAKIDGMGACMALKRRIWTDLGGFDERFGAGATFHAADEGEFALRALEAGWFVYETPAVSVIHRGLRGRTEAHALVHRYAYGTGAMMAKHVRARTPYAKRLLGTMAWRWARGRMHSAVRIDGGRHRWLRLDGFVRGFVAGALAETP
jgi:GT2 family glycosyltransferase